MGLMGHGIAQMAAEKFQVVAFDANDDALKKGNEAIKGSLEKVWSKKLKDDPDAEAKVAKNVNERMSRISLASSVEDLADCDIIVEAIIENLDIKRDFYKKLGEVCDPNTILASNTSSFPINELAVASGRPEKVVGLHFFNPVQLMRLVEVIRTDSTDEKVFEKSYQFAKDLKREPVKCKDTPGFIVNRLLVPYLTQAMQLLDRGDASAEDIDTAMRLGAGHPMGPLHLADYIGHDTILAIVQGWIKLYPDNPDFQEPECLKKLVAEGKLGRKTGEGFYKWEGNKKL
mmetsp:Transcript_9907/g.12344  ORF Transcript_9907/g.12344 Transcript_9907/m.12344 type:complete len:287 (+) Transcript_9907:81-941(+)